MRMRPLFVWLLSTVLLLSLAALALLAFTKQRLVDAAMEQSRADLAAIALTQDVADPLAAIELLETRDLPGNADRQAYIILDPETGERVAGNLDDWPQPEALSSRMLSSSDLAGAAPLVGRYDRLDGYFPMFVGRWLTDYADFRDRLVVACAIILVSVLITALVVSLIGARRLQNRLDNLSDRMAAFSAGDRQARTGDQGADALGRVSRRIDTMLDLVGERLQSREVVAERIAHELRRPVAHAALKVAETEKPQEAAAIARTVIDDLLATIDAVLFITDMRLCDTGKAPVMLDEIARDVIDLYGDVADAKRIVLEHDLRPASIMGERALIERMIANLLDNALKFSPPGGGVTVRVDACGDQARLVVLDTGPGMAGLPEEPGLLMNRGSAGMREPGMGLGLALVLRIVQWLGGRVEFADHAPRGEAIGLAVTVALPLA